MKNVNSPIRRNQKSTERFSRRIDDGVAYWHSASDGYAQLRQIEEFTLTYYRKLRTGMCLAAILVAFTLACMALFIMGVNVLTFFSVGALVLSIQTLISGYAFYQEEQRTLQAYH